MILVTSGQLNALVEEQMEEDPGETVPRVDVLK